jgi:hypothetical protein
MGKCAAKQATSPERQTRRRLWRKLLGITLSLAVLALLTALVRHLVDTHMAQRELDETIATVSAVEPLATMTDLEAARSVVADKDNSALPVRGSAQHLPANWPSREMTEWFTRLTPQSCHEPANQVRLQAELRGLDGALQDVRQLPDLPQGRFPIVWSPDFVSTPLDHLPQTRAVAALLELDATRRAQEGDIHGSLRSLRGVLNVGRALADEPTVPSQLARTTCLSAALRGLERTMAQGVSDEADLRQMQQLLEDEARQLMLLVAARGARAGIHQLFVALENGDRTLDDLAGGPRPTGLDAVEEMANTRLGRPRILEAHACSLRYVTRLIEIGQLAAEQWLAATDQLERDFADPPPIASMLIKTLASLPRTCCRNQARLRCASTALAAERYRLKHGKWPESIDQLCPAFLAAVPLDPYDGKPLRLRVLQDGIVIYSVGPDREDNGGKLDRVLLVTPGTDLGFQLWDVGMRGRKPGS